MERSKYFLGSGIIILFHIVGFIGFQWEITRNLFEQLVPLNLLLSLTLLALFHVPKSRRWVVFAMLTILTGYIIEVLGVQTGIIFGTYSYDTALGPKFLGVPPIIGINWLMLVYSVGIITQKLSSHSIIKILVGTGMMILIDILIEPVAIEYHFWHWEHESVPLQNYLSWGIVAAGLLTYFHYIPEKAHNPLAWVVYLTQLLFFGAFALI